MNLLEWFQRKRSKALLEDKIVSLRSAERCLSFFRMVAFSTTIPTLLLAGLVLWNRPAARARAHRIVADRTVALAMGGMAVYDEGIRETTDLMIRIHRSNLPDQDKLKLFFTVDAERIQFRTDRQAIERVLKVAQSSKTSVPFRLWPWSPWSDPLTGSSYPLGANPEAIAKDLARRTLEGPEGEEFIRLVASASRPGAGPLPGMKSVLAD